MPRPGRVRPPTTAVGRQAERLAASHLERAGLEILVQNEVAGGVEIDIIAREPTSDGVWVYVFIEVRARESLEQGLPIETIGPRKRRRLLHGAAAWLTQHDLWERVEVRFDVCGVLLGESPTVQWHRGAFDADDG